MNLADCPKTPDLLYIFMLKYRTKEESEDKYYHQPNTISCDSLCTKGQFRFFVVIAIHLDIAFFIYVKTSRILRTLNSPNTY